MANGNVMIMADFNAYVPNGYLDYIVKDGLDNHIPLPNDIYCPDTPLTRNTMDLRELNQNGKSLIELCKSTSVRIVNGRVIGDNCGKFTRFPIYESANYQPSVLDYALSDTVLLPKIKFFSVSDLTRFSDYCSIMLSIQTNFNVNSNDNSNTLPSLAPPKLVWKNHYKMLLEGVFKSENCQSHLNKFCNQVYNNNQAAVDLATEHLSNIITSATERVIPTKQTSTNRRKKKPKKKWFDKTCFELRNELNRLSIRLGRDPFNPHIKKAFVQCRRQYRKLLKSKEKQYFTKLKAELKNLEQRNPKQFWSIIRNLQKDDSITYNNPIDNETWEDYFNKLYQRSSNVEKVITDSTDSVSYLNHEEVAIDKILNHRITKSEMKKAIKNVKMVNLQMKIT